MLAAGVVRHRIHGQKVACASVNTVSHNKKGVQNYTIIIRKQIKTYSIAMN